jgi:uncharacterized coiled-coil protein SlyX
MRELEAQLALTNRQRNELSEIVDPSNQLIKSMAKMVSTLQEGMDTRHRSDAEVTSVVLGIQKSLEDRIALLEDKFRDEFDQFSYKLNDHED